MRSTLISFVCLIALSGFALGQSQWKVGRSTFYPKNGEAPTNPNNLACVQSRKPNFTPRSSTWYGAVSDHSGIFGGPQCTTNEHGGDPKCPGQGSCGKCFEIRCVGKFPAYNGGDKTCRGNSSVVIEVVDACPGNGHPINEQQPGQYGISNPWCRDTNVDHFDLNRNAFEQIANTRDGVIRMQYREVSCSNLGPQKIDWNPSETTN
ncbi:RlpA-like double-psi beta-barrel-protein domain-containing protein-containing protein [Paraphysoderma sedebokerense]|nr:RlpA-like double-psi beta-barrel-protein domain-containing protein-containing protein [Paraphysoderma sedebokerense]